jgi:hypothetical protein
MASHCLMVGYVAARRERVPWSCEEHRHEFMRVRTVIAPISRLLFAPTRHLARFDIKSVNRAVAQSSMGMQGRPVPIGLEMKL